MAFHWSAEYCHKCAVRFNIGTLFWKWKHTDRHLDILYKLYYSAYHNKCRLHTHTCPPSLWFFCLVSRLCHFDHCTSVKLAAILQLSQYCTFDGDSISTVITEPGQPVKSSSPRLHSTLSSTNKILAVGQQVQRQHSICIFLLQLVFSSCKTSFANFFYLLRYE